MNQNGTSEVYSYFREDFIVVFNTEPSAGYEEVCAIAQKKFAVMREYVRRYFSLEITGALSGICTGLAQLGKAVEETGRVLDYRIDTECGVLHTALDAQRPEITTVKQYVREHLDGEITLEDAARAVNMSQSYFSHIFKDEMKISFIDYVNRMRMQRACQLLKNPRLKINEVAARVGIENFNYFSVLFKKVIGLPPNAYREQLALPE